MKFLAGLILGLLLGTPMTVRGQAPQRTGAEIYLALDEDDQELYLAGAYRTLRNILTTERSLGRRLDPSEVLTRCTADEGGRLRNATLGQIRAIVTKFVRENPSDWRYSIETLVFGAVSRTCTTP